MDGPFPLPSARLRIVGVLGDPLSPTSDAERPTVMPRILLYAAAWFVLFLGACMPWENAFAQEARISIGVGGGVGLPLSASDRFVPRFADADFVGDHNPTVLVHQVPKLGMLLQLDALIGNLSIRYAFQRYGWQRDRIACSPADDAANATRLPNGEFDDRMMDYHCARPRGRMAAPDDRRALQMHQISGAYEIAAVQPRILIPYASIGAGILLTTFQTASQNNALRPGLMLAIGGGVRIPFDRNISMFIETRYALHLMARGGDYSLRAGRAVAADKTILSATIDPLHSIQALIGFRLRVR